MKKIIVLLISGAFMTAPSIAQPTLSGGDCTPVIGESYTIHQTAHESAGPAGANQTWDFSHLASAGTLTYNVVPVSSGTDYTSFPNATIAIHLGGTNYEYLVTDATQIARAGVHTSGVSIPFSDPEKYLGYPFTYNSNYTDNFYGTFVNGVTFTRSGSVTVTADGYGTLVMPYGTVSNVLRVKATENYTDTYTGGTIAYTSENYYWYKPGVHYILLSFSTLNVNGAPYANTASYLDGSAVGLGETDGLVASMQVFPNPSSSVAQVGYSLEADADVEIQVVNPVGQSVMHLAAGHLTAGEQVALLDISGLASGLYIIQLKADGMLAQRKLMVR